ncbi:MAG: SDR family NAD(P)-dependent oxidoreductase [Aquabacterium sp.]|uniref:SDR family NAD(P)-dependent oxidoreductase n=1 Tax=Aquabacterium sp. TaxID=1872578 RepID=UPI002721AC4A|nr:SDR family NAD(P)-dependent oxidoreductase [Aquabacterium sp.]MDO9001990.1 SDR family NAD(P)-dependent oxidoreductase [Aquabacterium sp.]
MSTAQQWLCLAPGKPANFWAMTWPGLFSLLAGALPGSPQRGRGHIAQTSHELVCRPVQDFFPSLRASTPSHIVMVSSGFGLLPATRAPIYSASKAGLRSFTKALRRQLEGQGITITD